MYVCVCHAINETRVREAVAQGRTSVRALREHFDFGECCGKCNACMRGLIDEEMSQQCIRPPPASRADNTKLAA